MLENEFMLSIIIPVFNHNNIIKDAINSIKQQSIGFSNLELIFVVDSTAGSMNKELKDYSNLYSNVKIIYLNKKCDFSGSLKNIGIYNSSAEYIIFLENVKKLYDYSFEILYNNINKNSDIVFGNWTTSTNHEMKNKWSNFNLDDNKLNIENIMDNPNVFTIPPAISSKIFKKSVIMENNLEFPIDIPCENLIFISDYLLKSENIRIIDNVTVEYSMNESLWENSKEIEYDKDYLLKLMESNIELYYLFKVDDNLSRICLPHLKYWFDLFIKSNLTVFERIELLKFSEFILSEFKKVKINHDFEFIIKLVCDKKFYEASVYSDLLHKKEAFKNTDYQKITQEIHEFEKSINNKTKSKYQIGSKIREFANELANYNIELYIFNKIINSCNNTEISKAIKLINEWELFNKDYYVDKYSYDFDLNPLLHYIYWGYKECKKPNKKFDGVFYRNYYENVAKSRLNPLVYFVLYGVNTGEVKINERVYSKPKNFVNKFALEDKIKQFNEQGIAKLKRNPQIIVSLTSFPDRMYELHFTLYSLLNQSLKPDHIILWLAKSQFPNGESDIPENVLNLKKNGLEIKWCDDFKSYKKLLPSLKLYPNDLIITADDDVYYPNSWLKELYENHVKYPKCIISQRARKIKLNDDYTFKSYKKWSFDNEDNNPSFLNLFTGAGGVLYPPNCLNKDVMKYDVAKKLVPSGDDFWFWAMAVSNKTKIKAINNLIDLTYVNLAREMSLLNQKTLWHSNSHGTNDENLKNILNRYPKISDIIKEDIENDYRKYMEIINNGE